MTSTDVMNRVRATPGVVGAAPFLINPMMITRGDRIAGVLVKGVDPARLGDVLFLFLWRMKSTNDGAFGFVNEDRKSVV